MTQVRLFSADNDYLRQILYEDCVGLSFLTLVSDKKPTLSKSAKIIFNYIKVDNYKLKH